VLQNSISLLVGFKKPARKGFSGRQMVKKYNKADFIFEFSKLAFIFC
jgi:hypothetical protein